MTLLSIGLLLGAVFATHPALAAPALPTTNAAALPGTYIWISSVNDTIFGEDSSNFDYFLTSSSLQANESVETLASAISTGTEHDILVAFLNSTMAGTMTIGQATNTTWKCNELSDSMASIVSFCPDPTDDDDVPTDSSVSVEKRSRWRWLKSAKHVASNAAVQIMYGALGNAAYANFPSSPRSWCNSANGGNACISWSNVENFNHAYARTMVSDALGVTDFNHYSAQANGILGRKRNAADVCISNRASGCT